MADTKISALSAAAALDGTEELPVVQSAATVKTTAADIAALAGASLLGYTHVSLAASVTATGTTFTDVDATNAVVTFEAATTSVLVRLTAVAEANGTTEYAWNLRDAGGDISGTDRSVMWALDGGVQIHQSVVIVVTGLTVGNSYTWKWGHARPTGGSGGAIHSNNASRPITMEVWSA